VTMEDVARVRFEAEQRDLQVLRAAVARCDRLRVSYEQAEREFAEWERDGGREFEL